MRTSFSFGLGSHSASLSTNCAIGQALADDALQRAVGALRIVDAKRHAGVVAEVKFGKVAMQVLFLAVLVHPAHAALQDGEHVLHGVAMDREPILVPDVFAASVTD